ncbi:MAG TPA: hypothetical protein VJM33_15385 [Microthrixaceae bacterium]|nr:hypothetical protein [Microthrixaceae bacterium]
MSDRPGRIDPIVTDLDGTLWDRALGRDFVANHDFHCSGFSTERAMDVLERFLSIGVEPVVNIGGRDVDTIRHFGVTSLRLR